MPEMTAEARALARAIHRLTKETHAHGRASQAAYRSVEITDGPVTYYDEDGNEVLTVGQQDDGFVASNYKAYATLPVPTAPDVLQTSGGLRIIHDGTYEDANTPSNFARLEVHVSQEGPFFECTDYTQIDAFTSVNGGDIIWPGPTSLLPWYVRIVLVDTAGNESVASVAGSNTIEPVTLEDPLTAPTTSPDIEATGLPGSILLRSEPVAPSTLIEYHIHPDPAHVFVAGDLATLVGVPTRATVVVVEKLPDGTPLDEDTTYSCAAIATNVAGSAAPSPSVDGKVNNSAIYAVIVAELVAGFIMTGRIEVGAAYWSAEDGLVFPQPDGGEIRFPVDGVTAAHITAHLTAKSLTVEDNANFYGLSQLFGIMRLANGITNPTAKPGMASTWSKLATGLAGDFEDIWRGLCTNITNAAEWVTVGVFLSNSTIRSVNFTTGAVNAFVFPTLSNFLAWGGITRLGSNYYLLGQYTDRSGWWVRQMDSSFVFTGSEFQYNAIGDSPYLPVIGSDGTNLIIAHVNASSYNPVVRQYSTAGSVVGGPITCTAQIKANLTGVYWGSADFGATRIVVTSETDIKVYNSGSGAEVTSQEWQRASGARIRGLIWDGTVFHHLDKTGKIWHYTPNPADQSVDGAITWVDRNATGGVHTTKIGPKQQYTWLARSQLVISFPTPPEYSSVSTDAANAADVYVGPHSGTMRLQAQPAVGVFAATIDTLNTGSAAEPGTNTFDAIAATPGRIESFATYGSSVPLWQFDGSGKAYAMKMLQSSTVATGAFAGAGVANGKTITVTFAVPFDSTPTVKIEPQVSDAAIPMACVVNGSVTTTQFQIFVYRNTGTSGFNINWQAAAMTQ